MYNYIYLHSLTMQKYVILPYFLFFLCVYCINLTNVFNDYLFKLSYKVDLNFFSTSHCCTYFGTLAVWYST